MKRLTITPEIEARLKNSVGEVPKDIAVYETIALNTLPVSKRGSIYNGAVHGEAFLKEMAAELQKNGSFLPIHTLHMQGYELPVGRGFYGEVLTNDKGLPELRVQYYISTGEADTEGRTLASRLDTGAINEVSVAVLPKHLNCSQCGWDFLSEENRKSHPWAIYDRTCGNDHVIGENGVHVLPNGLAKFFEMSLVSRGAANGAIVQGPSRARLSMDSEEMRSLAASGTAPEAAVMIAHFVQPTENQPKKESGQMSVDLEKHIKLSADHIVLQKETAEKDQRIASLEGTIKDKDAEIVKLTEAGGKAAELQAQNMEYSAFIAEQAKFAATALSLAESAIPTGVKEQIAFVKECGVKLHQMFPAGGRGNNSADDVETNKMSAAPAAAFKIKR